MLISENAYLVLGLGAHVDEKSVNKRYKEQLNIIGIDEVPGYDTDISFIDYKKIRKEENIKQAFLELSNERKRIAPLFFWFQLIDDKDYYLFSEFCKGNVSSALDGWKTLSDKGHHYRQNYCIAWILSYENKDKISDKVDWNVDTFVDTLYKYVNSDNYWDKFEGYISEQYKQDISHKDLTNFRKDVIRYIANELFDLSINTGNKDLYTKFRDKFGVDCDNCLENSKVKKILKRIDTNLQEVLDIKDKSDIKDKNSIMGCFNRIEENFDKIDALGIGDNHEIINLRDSVAKKIRDFGLNVFTIDDVNDALPLSIYAYRIVNSTTLKTKLKKDITYLEGALFKKGKIISNDIFDSSTLKKCSHCKRFISSDAESCMFCGTNFNETEEPQIDNGSNEGSTSKKDKTYHCPFCKSEINKDEEFCPSCGKLLKESVNKDSLERKDIIETINEIKRLEKKGDKQGALKLVGALINDKNLTKKERQELLDIKNSLEGRYSAPQHEHKPKSEKQSKSDLDGDTSESGGNKGFGNSVYKNEKQTTPPKKDNTPKNRIGCAGWFWIVVGIIIVISAISGMFSGSSNTKPTGSRSGTSSYTSSSSTSTTKTNNTSPKNNDSSKTYTPLTNGTILSKDYSFFNREGEHEVEINNTRGSVDSVFKLVSLSTNKSVYSVYVRKGYTVKIENIPNGKYVAYFASSRGKDQYGNLDIYGAEKDEDVWNFQSEIRGNYIYYDSMSITLYPVTNGNLETDNVSTSTFENL